MSLDLKLVAVVPTEVFSANITHNLGPMADAAGIYQALWRPDEHGYTAGDLVPVLEQGLAALRADPEKFRAMNPKNGWGSYESLIRFTEKVLAACKEHPEATLEASR